MMSDLVREKLSKVKKSDDVGFSPRKVIGKKTKKSDVAFSAEKSYR
jgi:hypothetical protein